MTVSSWGPFLPNLDPAERKARLRSLRTCVKLLVGPRGVEAATALLRAEISGDDAEMLNAAATEFGRLRPLDQRRVLASYVDVQSPNLRVVHG